MTASPSHQKQTEVPEPTRVVQNLPTAAAYDLWAPHYDTDGNFLQALDTLEMLTLLPEFLSRLVADESKFLLGRESEGLKIVDLGCGTGRNTLQLMGLASTYGIREIVGLDLSPAMLDVARKRIAEFQQSGQQRSQHRPPTTQTQVDLAQLDMLQATSLSQIPSIAHSPAGLVSTLVLEHVPLSQFFRIVALLLPHPGSYLLLTNMHSAMGALSGAGFIDPETGTKFRAESFAHTVDETVAEAKKWGFEVCEHGIRERGVDNEEMVSLLGSRSRKWYEWGGKCWFGGIFVKRDVKEMSG